MFCFLLGKDGVTHNMLVDVHNHWKRSEAVRIKCLGVPTLDMDNVCFHLEVWVYNLKIGFAFDNLFHLSYFCLVKIMVNAGQNWWEDYL